MAMAITRWNFHRFRENFHCFQTRLEEAGDPKVLKKYELCIGIHDCLVHVVKSLERDYLSFEREVLLSHVRPHHKGESVPDGWIIVTLIRKNHEPLQFQ
eukprot:2557951-Amphidinium_carterae.1